MNYTVVLEQEPDGGFVVSVPALPGCINAVRLLAFTGLRLGELLSLRWLDLDLDSGVIRLRDAKAGARTVPLGAPALTLLAAMERTGVHVVHGPDPAKPLSSNTFRSFWNRVRVQAKMPDGVLLGHPRFEGYEVVDLTRR